MKRNFLATVAVALIIPVIIAGLLFKNLIVGHPTKEESQMSESTEVRDHVELTEDKYEAAEIKVAPAARQKLQPHRSVPGRIEYNATRHVEVKAPFDGLIRRIDVKVGERVTDGQVLGVVDSPELGERRADVLLRESDLKQAKLKHEWWHAIQTNLDELLARLKRPQDLSSIERDKDEKSQLERDFANKPLGEFRERILAAYSRMRLDELLSNSMKNVGEATAKLRKVELESIRDTSRVKFAGACEQATFDAKQMHVETEAAMEDAERRLEVARQRLCSLVGQPPETIPPIESKSSLSTWPVKAPFTATVEEVLLPPNERIHMGQGLFQLADASRLWVQADIRERDWTALKIEPGQSITVMTPALPGKTLDATVSFIGRAVTADSRAVPLTADIDNHDGQLRPGMFVRVLIPDGEPRECLVIHESSIVTNDGRTFVFIETGTREYHPRDVKIGLRVDPWIEIVSGLKPGEPVVVSGTALLKAELLLQPED